ncbi:hypothetical protein l13_02680 [Neisseria weaveri ATCC 51223]|nr:hypothetical protein l13_02680 [Neisseria weaveri ATCC 51223]
MTLIVKQNSPDRMLEYFRTGRLKISDGLSIKVIQTDSVKICTHAE